jgi:hypothetical protein
MKPSLRFSQAARKVGLHLPGVSAANSAILAEMQTRPLPVIKRDGSTHNVRSPSPIATIGPLITHKLARMDGNHYVTTPAGDDYLTKLKAANLIPVQNVKLCQHPTNQQHITTRPEQNR